MFRWYELHTLKVISEVGNIAHCNGSYTRMLTNEMFSRGLNISNMTIAELLELDAECAEKYTKLEQRNDERLRFISSTHDHGASSSL